MFHYLLGLLIGLLLILSVVGGLHLSETSDDNQCQPTDIPTLEI